VGENDSDLPLKICFESQKTRGAASNAFIFAFEAAPSNFIAVQ
jgi:hypothetical protein